MNGKPRILVVDDELGPRESLRMILEDDYDIVTAANRNEALNNLNGSSFDLAILDIRMPDINGIDLLEIVKQKAPSTEVVMITAYASVDTATKALRLGAFDYLIKPFELSSVRDIVNRGISKRKETMMIEKTIDELQCANKNLESEIENTYSSIQNHYEETIGSLVAAVDAKDSYTKGHQERVARLVAEIVGYMRLPDDDRELMYRAATLHDIGKIGVAENILRKKCELSVEEYESVKKHSQIGADILSPAKFLQDLIPMVRHHHERIDGTGYPAGLRGEQIPLGARIIAVADAVDAMLWERPYAKAKSVDEVRAELLRVAGTQLDPNLVGIVVGSELFDTYNREFRH